LPARITYRVRMLSTPSNIDTLVSVAPQDTVYLQLPIATYGVTLDGFPNVCSVRDGIERAAVLYDIGTTSIVRYSISCKLSLQLNVITEGVLPTAPYVYVLSNGAGAERSGSAKINDTLRFDGLPAGEYRLRFGFVPSNCVLLSPGGRPAIVTVSPQGGGTAEAHFACADAPNRPVIAAFVPTLVDGAVGIWMKIVDPQKDQERVYLDITNCDGRSLTPGGEVFRRGLSTAPRLGGDTAIVATVFDLFLPDTATAPRCAAVRLTDIVGNTSTIVEQLLQPSIPTTNTINSWNASYLFGTTLRLDVQSKNPTDPTLMWFIGLRVRDGVLAGVTDGFPDRAIVNTTGSRGSTVVDVALGNGRPQYGDYQQCILYTFDATGRMARIVDADMTQ
jgi:hypothetical protein